MSRHPGRLCDCPHGFPVCACALGLDGPALLDRSRRLSVSAGWPSPLSADAVRAATPKRREDKPRLDLAASVRQARDCVPCRAAKDPA